MHATVHRLAMRDPGDVSALAALLARREIDPQQIVAILGKTEGNGLVNDYTRGYFTQSLKLLLGEHAERPLYIFSGGTEGVLSPHYAVFSAEPQAIAPHPSGKALAVGCAVTRELQPDEIGTRAQADMVSQAVKQAMRSALMEAGALRFRPGKGPRGTPAPTGDPPAARRRRVGVAAGRSD